MKMHNKLTEALPEPRNRVASSFRVSYNWDDPKPVQIWLRSGAKFQGLFLAREEVLCLIKELTEVLEESE